MSFIDTLGNVAKSAGAFLKGNSLGSSLAKTAILGFALNKVNKSMNKANEVPDTGARVQVNPNTNAHIPVVYGEAYVPGIITDAYMSPGNNKEMYFCVTLSEKTGALINGSPSTFSFKEAYIDGLRLRFQSDGNTVDLAYDEDGNSTDKFQGLIEMYPYKDGSTSPALFTSETTGNLAAAYSIMPHWSSTNMMSSLCFVIVKVTYNKEKKITNLGNLQFRVENSMTQPGDVLNDYLTNTTYGAGLPSAEVYTS